AQQGTHPSALVAMVDEQRLAGSSMADEALVVLPPHHVVEVLERKVVDRPQAPAALRLAGFFPVRPVPGPLPRNSLLSTLWTFWVALPWLFDRRLFDRRLFDGRLFDGRLFDGRHALNSCGDAGAQGRSFPDRR